MNKLKLNITKTELFFMGSDAQRGRLARQEFSLQDGVIAASSLIRNLGFQLNSELTASNHIAVMKKEINFKLHNLYKIRGCSNEFAAKAVIQAVVISRRDYCNSLFYGASSKDLNFL